jgi:hypothetical protein
MILDCITRKEVCFLWCWKICIGIVVDTNVCCVGGASDAANDIFMRFNGGTSGGVDVGFDY